MPSTWEDRMLLLASARLVSSADINQISWLMPSTPTLSVSVVRTTVSRLLWPRRFTVSKSTTLELTAETASVSTILSSPGTTFSSRTLTMSRLSSPPLVPSLLGLRLTLPTPPRSQLFGILRTVSVPDSLSRPSSVALTSPSCQCSKTCLTQLLSMRIATVNRVASTVLTTITMTA